MNLIRVINIVSLMVLIFIAAQAAEAQGKRNIISLDGQWEIAEGKLDKSPERFDHKIPVPGLLDMANPQFEEIGFKSTLRQAFWYKRKFNIDAKDIQRTALLKVHKAMFGTKLILNGKVLGEHLTSFTPLRYDVTKYLKPGENELLIRVGAFTDVIPKPIPSGWDYEKERFIPGIFDSVELILTGTPFIERVQTVPDLRKDSVKVLVWLSPAESKIAKIHLSVKEARTGKIVGEASCLSDTAGGDKQCTAQVNIKLSPCHLWSPEDPFLYELIVKSQGDEFNTRFGMRSFNLDPKSGRAMLNGKPYFMRGSNVTLYRFFEDSERGDKPWNKDWVRRMHRAFKDMHWNSLRYCIGFPPEFWYEIADEEGFLIQDEFPIWNMDAKKGDFDAKELASEYREWMKERWNHPCVVIWDACNETKAPETGAAIELVRKLDLSNRPWDNGWSKPARSTDSKELHPYHFQDPKFTLSQMTTDPGTLDWKPGKSPIIVNEYGWLWLNRDGSPTALTRELYGNLLGANSSTKQRQELYARYMAAETEFWRARRACAAVLHFCALGYSRPVEGATPKSGATSDHWLDLEKLSWEPLFFEHVRDAFAPVGLMIDAWSDSYPAGQRQEFPVSIINDLDKEWQGKIRLRLLKSEKVVNEISENIKLQAFAKDNRKFALTLPKETGDYQLEASLLESGSNNKLTRSLRDFKLQEPAERKSEN